MPRLEHAYPILMSLLVFPVTKGMSMMLSRRSSRTAYQTSAKAMVARTPNDLLSILVLVLREHGLIVLALGALVWQVWWLGSLAREQQVGWRATIHDLTEEIQICRAHQAEANIRTVTFIASVQEIMRNTQSRLADIEVSCQVSTTKSGAGSMGSMR
jgi:hypothetical protein